MGIFKKPDSKFYWLYLRKDLPKERLDVRIDAPTAAGRRDNEKLAEDIFHQRMTALARGEAGLATTKPTITFCQFAQWYLVHVTPKKRSARRERGVLAHWMALLDQPLHSIDKARILEAQTERLKSVVASTVNREMDIIKRVFKEAVPKYLASSPIEGMRRLHVKGVGLRLLSREDERQLLTAPSLDPRVRALILLGLDTLLRLNDARTLRRDQVHGDRVQVIDPKAAPYWVDLSHRLRAALDAVAPVGTSPYYFQSPVFPQPVPVLQCTVDSWFKDACTQAGLVKGRAGGGVTFHGLRHTGTTRALKAGVNPRAVQEMGGWKSLRQLERYGHVDDHEKRRATAAIAGEVFRPDRLIAFPQRSRTSKRA